MGKKSDKKSDDGTVRKKKGKAGKAAAEPLMLRVQRCPPVGGFVFEWVVGNGIGKHAVRDALQAFREAYALRVERAHQAAMASDFKCAKKCGDGSLMVQGPICGVQSWEIDGDSDPPTASTWNWVGYSLVKNCECSKR